MWQCIVARIPCALPEEPFHCSVFPLKDGEPIVIGVEQIMDITILGSPLLFVISLLNLGTGIHAFRRYSTVQNERLFAVGIAMTITAIGAMCGALDHSFLLPSFHLDWAWYAGTTCGYFLLFLCSIMKSAEQFLVLKRWSIITAAVIVMIILLLPILPDDFEIPSVSIFLNCLRVTVCLLIFLRYLTLYIYKDMRFSLFMCLAFLFLAVGYAILIPQALDPIFIQLPIVDIVLRVIGSTILFVAFVKG